MGAVIDPVGRASAHAAERRLPLAARWQLLATAPGTAETTAALRAALAAGAGWVDIPGPGTVAAVLRALGQWSLDGPMRRFDAEDWWFRATFEALPPPAGDTCREMEFEGLAGVCEAWLDDARLLTSDNMHRRHRRPAPTGRPEGHELLMRFAALDGWLAGTRRPRPRWRAPMVEHQQLRWARQTLLGRTPGWSPPVAPVGPWRGIGWVETRRVRIERLRLQSLLQGSTGDVRIEVEVTALQGAVASVQLVLERDGSLHRQTLAPHGHAARRYSGVLSVPNVARWWPHTHGEPALYDARLEIQLTGGGPAVTAPLHRLGFRSLGVDTADGDFALRIDGTPIFCRGACWTPLDVVTLRATPAATRAALLQARSAGMNMLRISGAMVAEDAAFFDACDEFGILVWQDLMFASMDFPAEDAAFIESVREEVAQQLDAWQGRASLAVVCGNSEAEQQAAMWGAPKAHWSQPLFAQALAEQVRSACPGVHYWPSSAHGGALPQQPNAGTTSYYGVGAYLRPLDDARRSGLRFATECLAFANIPSDATLARIPGGAGQLAHHAGWKSRSPRDLGAGWDFDDVRDHYLRELFKVDPVALRSREPARYLALGRAASAEAIAASFAEWRRPASGCRGALVWFLRDLWAGAGWGLVDERGRPKAAFHAVRRTCAPIAIFLSDEGTNGLEVHVVNDPAVPLEATVELAAYRDDGLRLLQASQVHRIPAHGGQSWPAASWFDGFVDLSRAFRFGPAEHSLLVATLRDAAGATLGEAFHFTEGLPSQQSRDIGLQASLEACADDGSAWLTVTSRDFAQSVQVEVPGFVAEDDHFHLPPNGRRRLRLLPDGEPPGPGRLRPGQLQALNSQTLATVELA